MLDQMIFLKDFFILGIGRSFETFPFIKIVVAKFDRLDRLFVKL